MRDGPSRTAVTAAMHGAAHVLLDEAPHILTDTLACRLAGYASGAELMHALCSRTMLDFPRMRTIFALRNRCAEDELARAFNSGITQYIILGAGLDSFAYRRPVTMEAVDVFEIDHPVSQEWKRSRIADLGITPPPRLHHVPVDFECQTLSRRLADSGVNLAKPVFLSWLGTTQYLTTAAVLQSLRDIATTTASGSELVLQVIVPSAALAPDEATLLSALATRAASVGEPWLKLFRTGGPCEASQ
jgi:methyltransferase (TIGR00027 family)